MKVFCFGGSLDGQWVQDRGDKISQRLRGEDECVVYGKFRVIATGAPVVYTVYVAEGTSFEPDEIIDRFTAASRRPMAKGRTHATHEMEDLAKKSLDREYDKCRERLAVLLSRYAEDERTQRCLQMWINGELPTFAALQKLLTRSDSSIDLVGRPMQRHELPPRPFSDPSEDKHTGLHLVE